MADQLVPPKKECDTGMAYILWLASFVGLAGIHRLYMGRWASGLLWLFTGGLCMVGTIIDGVMMPRMIEDTNQGARVW
jgi:TM2 domain-containing membrane protein YozV